MSQAVVRLTKIWFDKKYKENGIEIVFYKRYVNDGNTSRRKPKRTRDKTRVREQKYKTDGRNHG